MNIRLFDDQINELESEYYKTEGLAIDFALQQIDDSTNNVLNNFDVHKTLLLKSLEENNKNSEVYLSSMKGDVQAELLKIDLLKELTAQQNRLNDRISAVLLIHKLQMERFGLRICTLLNRIANAARQGNACTNDIEFNILCGQTLQQSNDVRRIQDKLGGTNASIIISVIQIYKANNAGIIRSFPSMTAKNEKEFHDICGELAAWAIHSSVRPSSGRHMLASTNKAALLNKQDSTLSKSPRNNSARPVEHQISRFLSAADIEWLHPASYNPCIWDKVVFNNNIHGINHEDMLSNDFHQFVLRFSSQHLSFTASNYIYYCIEERSYNSLLANTEHASTAYTSQLESVYLSKKDGGNTNSKPHPTEVLPVTSYLSTHRSESIHLKTFPDIIKSCSESGTRHFAPASTCELLNTRAFHRFPLTSDQVRALAHSSTFWQDAIRNKAVHDADSCLLNTLYIVVKVVSLPVDQSQPSTSPPVDCILMPLAEVCMNELISAHLEKYCMNGTDAAAVSDGDWDGEGDSGRVHRDWSTCSALLPDHARDRQASSRTNKTDFAGEYALVALGEGRELGGATSQPGLYFVQLASPGQPTAYHPVLAGARGGTDQAAEAHQLHARDDELLRTLLCASQRSEPVLGLLASTSEVRLSTASCQWRSCCWAASREHPTPPLCLYHQQLKQFLESSSAKASFDASKFLGRRSSSLTKADSIAGAGEREANQPARSSPLIDELKSGALRKAVRSFLKRRGETMRFTHMLRHSLDSPNRPAPAWSSWKDTQAFESASTQIQFSLEHTEALWKLEKHISEETQALSRLDVYPTLELATIRKQFKYLREQQEAGRSATDPEFHLYLEDLELRVTENKLALLHTRRCAEEDARIAYRRKIARLKSVEAEQSKDPANFRNQKKF